MTNSVFLKVILLGDSNVGKTSLMNKYVKNIFSTYTKYTFGVDLTTKTILIDHNIVTLQIWDTAGQERFNSLCTSYFRGSDCCVFVYDVTNSQSFENLDYWYDKFLTNGAPKDMEGFPFVLVANKVDLPCRQVSTRQSKNWCNSKNNCLFYETSAKDGINVDLVFERVAEMAMRREIEIWDTAGQERFDSLRTSYYRGSDGCVLVYDLTNPHSFEKLNHWYNQFIAYAAPKDKEHFPFVLVGNKKDKTPREVSSIQAEEWCNSKNHCPYFETSAKDGINVDFAFEKVATMAIGREIKTSDYFPPDLVFPEKQKTSSNCETC